MIGCGFSCIALFLLSNYAQARNNVGELSKRLEEMKISIGIDSDKVFEEWRAEEEMYLKTTQSTTSDDDMLPRAYVTTLKKLAESQ